MSSEEYKKVLAYIKHCILATDLVKYFTNIAKLKPIIKSGSFDWNNKEHRYWFCEAYYEKELIFTINSFSHSLTHSLSLSQDFYYLRLL